MDVNVCLDLFTISVARMMPFHHSNGEETPPLVCWRHATRSHRQRARVNAETAPPGAFSPSLTSETRRCRDRQRSDRHDCDRVTLDVT